MGDAVLSFDILVVPRSSREAVGPAVGDRLRVAVRAPPVDGAANAAVIEALAAAFGVKRAAVTIVAGQSGRRKRIGITAGLGVKERDAKDAKELKGRLEQLLAGRGV